MASPGPSLLREIRMLNQIDVRVAPPAHLRARLPSNLTMVASAGSNLSVVHIPEGWRFFTALEIRLGDPQDPNNPWRLGHVLTPDEYRSRQKLHPPLFDESELDSSVTEQLEAPYDDEDRSRLKFQLNLVMESLLDMRQGFRTVRQRLEHLSPSEIDEELNAFFHQSVPGDERTVFDTICDEHKKLLPRLADQDDYPMLWRVGQVPGVLSSHNLRSVTGSDGSLGWEFTHSGLADPMILLGEDELSACRGFFPSLTDRELARLSEVFEVPDDTEDHSKLRLQAEIARATLIDAANVHNKSAVRYDRKLVGSDERNRLDTVATLIKTMLLLPPEESATDAALADSGFTIPFPFLRTNETLQDYLVLHSRGLLDTMADHADYTWLRRKTQASPQIADSESHASH